MPNIPAPNVSNSSNLMQQHLQMVDDMSNIYSQFISTAEVYRGPLDGGSIVEQLLKTFRLAVKLNKISEAPRALCSHLFRLMIWAVPESKWSRFVRWNFWQRLSFKFHSFYCQYIDKSEPMRMVLGIGDESAELRHNLLLDGQAKWKSVSKEMEASVYQWKILSEFSIIGKLISNEFFAHEILVALQQNGLLLCLSNYEMNSDL